MTEISLCEKQNPWYFALLPNDCADGLKTSGGAGSVERIFSPWGSAQPIEKAQFGQGNPRKSKPFFFDSLCPALLAFAGFG
jgi:hypothetical protein